MENFTKLTETEESAAQTFQELVADTDDMTTPPLGDITIEELLSNSAIQRFLNSSTAYSQLNPIIPVNSNPTLPSTTATSTDDQQIRSTDDQPIRTTSTDDQQPKRKRNTTAKYHQEIKQRRIDKSKKLNTIFSKADKLSIETGLQIQIIVFDPEPTVQKRKKKIVHYSPNIRGQSIEPGEMGKESTSTPAPAPTPSIQPSPTFSPTRSLNLPQPLSLPSLSPSTSFMNNIDRILQQSSSQDHNTVPPSTISDEGLSIFQSLQSFLSPPSPSIVITEENTSNTLRPTLTIPKKGMNNSKKTSKAVSKTVTRKKTNPNKCAVCQTTHNSPKDVALRKKDADFYRWIGCDNEQTCNYWVHEGCEGLNLGKNPKKHVLL